MNTRFRSGISVNDEEVEEYYRNHPGLFLAPPSVRLRLIYLGDDDPGLLQKRLGLIEEELGEGVPFAELARQYSEGPAVEEGGDLGYLERAALAPVIARASEGLDPGEVSGAVRGGGGVYLVQLVDEKKSKPRPLEEVADEIRNILFQEEFDKRYNLWLEQMKDLAYIDVRL